MIGKSGVESIFTAILNSTSPRIKQSLTIIEEAIALYPKDLWFSFNAGKDNTVCFYLVASVLFRRNGLASTNFTMPCLYFEEENPFDECDYFMETMKSKFAIDVLVMKNVDNLAKQKFMKATLGEVIGKRGMRAIMLGTRRTDPYSGSLTFISRSSTEDGWPEFARVFPILDWDFREIFAFLNLFKIPYCPLYDRGYTYLGDKNDCVPNPFLRTKGGWYLPASAGSSNVEPFSRKSIIKNLNINESGKIVIDERSVRHLVIRVEYDLSPSEIKKQFSTNIHSFNICQTIMNETNSVIRFDINLSKSIQHSSTTLIKDQIDTEEQQTAVLERILWSQLCNLTQQLRVPIYFLYLDTVRKNCMIYG